MIPGSVTLFGSGETSSTGGRIFDTLVSQALLQHSLPSLRISVMETPAGFEVNAGRVAGRVSEFLATRLQNYHPHISQIAARKKGTPLSPDSPEVVAPLYESSLIFLGPGSPSYAVRQLQGSLAWDILQARHRLGASLVFASAAAIAAGHPALPVYEIYKAGEDPHWKPGLDLLGPYGLDLVILPHWNNTDGGAELDTSRCFMGLERFQQLQAQLPAERTILGIDEMTALTLDFQAGACRVAGLGSLHLLRESRVQDFPTGSDFPIHELGSYRPLSTPEAGLPIEVWQQAQQTEARLARQMQPPGVQEINIPPELLELVKEREDARQKRDWPRADRLRQQISGLGWKVADTPDGPQIQPLEGSSPS